jgi:hypothetical protein
MWHFYLGFSSTQGQARLQATMSPAQLVSIPAQTSKMQPPTSVFVQLSRHSAPASHLVWAQSSTPVQSTSHTEFASQVALQLVAPPQSISQIVPTLQSMSQLAVPAAH